MLSRLQQQCMDEYNLSEAQVIAIIMCQFNERMETSKIHPGNPYVVPFSLKKGIQKFGEPGRQSAVKEMKQLHNRKRFEPIKRKYSQQLRRNELWNLKYSLLR